MLLFSYRCYCQHIKKNSKLNFEKLPFENDNGGDPIHKYPKHHCSSKWPSDRVDPEKTKMGSSS